MDITTLEIVGAAKSTEELDEAMHVFMSAPSFSTRQRALEQLFRNICRADVMYSDEPLGR
ncbi:MAG: hypothetical protein VB032_03380 [Burkholderiaceae bacterium]|nr:hypothetical protein [Burkholderiaceae bacterium]